MGRQEQTDIALARHVDYMYGKNPNGFRAAQSKRLYSRTYKPTLVEKIAMRLGVLEYDNMRELSPRAERKRKARKRMKEAIRKEREQKLEELINGT